jgi:hypothetical protein
MERAVWACRQLIHRTRRVAVDQELLLLLLTLSLKLLFVFQKMFIFSTNS